MRIREGASRCFMQCLAEELRSGWEDAGIGVAAWKQVGMGLWVQRSGREGTVVGFAVWKHVETDGLMQRSGREGTGMGVAARNQADTYLQVQRSGWERACVGFAEQEVYLMWRRSECLKMCALGAAQINSNQLQPLKSSRSRERLARSFQVCMGNSRSVWVSPGMSWQAPAVRA